MTTSPTATHKVVVMGWPITHSRSPLIHSHWIKALGVANASYEKLAVKPEDLVATLERFDALGYVGANVTVPHKETLFQWLLEKHHVDESARQLKAVNTLVKTPDGWEGRNTDGYGFMANLADRLKNFDPQKGPALILGAGGASRAIVAALAKAGVPEMRIANRTKSRAEYLVNDLGVAAKVYEWEELDKGMAEAALVVNTTSLGMSGMDPLIVDLSPLPIDAAVTDIVYAPLETDLLAQARARGNQVADGLGMLLHQAVPGFEAWFGVRPEVTETLRTLILKDLGEA